LGDQNIESIATVTYGILPRDVMVTLDGSDNRHCMASTEFSHRMARINSVTERKDEYDGGK
jgi:hypothetical protein